MDKHESRPCRPIFTVIEGGRSANSNSKPLPCVGPKGIIKPSKNLKADLAEAKAQLTSMRGRGKPDLNTKIEEALSFPCRFGESALEAGFSPMDCFGVSPHYDFGRRRPHPEENKCGLAFLIDKKADCKFSEQRIEIIVGGKRLEIQRCQLNRDSDWDLIWEAFKLQQ